MAKLYVEDRANYFLVKSVIEEGDAGVATYVGLYNGMEKMKYTGEYKITISIHVVFK